MKLLKKIKLGIYFIVGAFIVLLVLAFAPSLLSFVILLGLSLYGLRWFKRKLKRGEEVPPAVLMDLERLEEIQSKDLQKPGYEVFWQFHKEKDERRETDERRKQQREDTAARADDPRVDEPKLPAQPDGRQSVPDNTIATPASDTGIDTTVKRSNRKSIFLTKRK